MSFRASRFCVAVSNMPARFLFLGPGIWRLHIRHFWHGIWHGIVHFTDLFRFSGYRDVGSSVCFSAFLHPLDGKWLAGDDGLFGFPPIYVSSFGGGELLSHGMALVDR